MKEALREKIAKLAHEQWSRTEADKFLVVFNADIKQLQQQRDELLEACKNLVRGQLQHPTFEGYVEHAVWVAEQAIANAKEV